jgi:hypothetical protein
MGLPREERMKGREGILESTMTENFPKLMSNMKPHIWEAQRKPRKINAKKNPYLGISLSNCRKSETKSPERG